MSTFLFKVAWAQMTQAAWMLVIMALNRILIALDYFPEQLIIYCSVHAAPHRPRSHSDACYGPRPEADKRTIRFKHPNNGSVHVNIGLMGTLNRDFKTIELNPLESSRLQIHYISHVSLALYLPGGSDHIKVRSRGGGGPW